MTVAALAATVGTVASATLVAVPAAAAPAIRNYVALGDSYSSGEGLAPYERGTNTTSNSCHRSDQAYPDLVADRLGRGTTFVFRACSGGRIAALTTSFKTEPAQTTWLSGTTDLVTISIGGNDAEWADTIRACAQVHNGGVDKPTLWDGFADCDAKIAAGPALIENITNHLYASYKLIRSKAPTAKIRVMTYPPIFPDRADTTKACALARRAGLTIALSATRERQMMNLQKQLNSAIVLATNRMRTDFELGDVFPADPTEDWGGYRYGHTIDCGDSGRPKPWINALRTENWPKAPMGKDLRAWWTANAKEVFVQSPGSFHPTVAGQKAMAQTMYRTLSFTAPATPLRILTTRLPQATAGTFYTASLQAKGGTLPYRWSVSRGDLPAGLTLAADGSITGTPHSVDGPATSTVTVVVADGRNVVESRQLSLSVRPGANPVTGVLVKAAMDGQPVPEGGQFFEASFVAQYRSGTVRITGSADGTEQVTVDDVLSVTVNRPDGTTRDLTRDFSGGCGPLAGSTLDLTPLLLPGDNTLTIVLRDQCGSAVGNTDIYLNAENTTFRPGVPVATT
ncbi:hypothetical protein Voc01_086810 [Virgisporangium ochraceum]|uniref:SGNH hydrolase-type esterase domain-containing protein n=2 Tax=Virgisporangium ochraceum TaxID=65505 RepID=A0A8J4EGC7_9ACTN|nr:hypothetical protein Voc01_086810 [Virgisporangium ochraceum]